MQCINEVTILGRLGEKVRTYSTASGKPFATFPVCTNETVKNATTEKEIKTWHNCEAWGNMATIIGRLNIAVGQELIIKGKLRNSSFQNADGTKMNKTVITVLDLKIFPMVAKQTNFNHNQED